MDRDAQVVGIFRHLEVKRGIIDQNNPIGVPLVDGTTRSAQKTEDFPQMLHHIGKAHIGHVAVMDDGLNSCLCSHQVTAQETELRHGIFLLE